MTISRTLASCLALLMTATAAFAQPISGAAHDILTCVSRTPDGHYLAGGYSSSFMARETAAVICLLDTAAQAVWTMDYDSEWWDETAAVMADEDGNFWLAGATRPDGGLFDWLVCKYAEGGQLLWSNVYFEEQPSAAVGIVTDGNSGAFVLGFVEIDDTKQFGLAHLDGSGTALWSTTTDYTVYHTAKALARTTDGGLIVAGQRNANNEDASDLSVTRFSSAGELLLDSLLPQPLAQHCTGVDVTSSGEILLSGFTVADTLSEQTDAMLVKLSADGEMLWLNQYGDTANDRFHGVTIYGGDSILVCGVSQDPATLEKVAVLYNVTPNGETEWTRSYGYNEHAEILSVDGISSDEFMAVGFADPDEAHMTDYLVANASSDNANTPVTLPPMMQALAYPNPTNSSLQLHLTLPRSTELTITLNNVLGQRISSVAHGRFTAGTHRLPVSLHQVASGNYFILLEGNGVDAVPLRVVVVK